ncbi:MAG: hypothetical protein AAGU11_15125 [Syntrophobacteraceae bacterium]
MDWVEVGNTKSRAAVVLYKKLNEPEECLEITTDKGQEKILALGKVS